MLKIIIAFLTLTLLFSCKKNVVKVYPEIVGDWQLAHWCQSNDFHSASLSVDADGMGEFIYNDYVHGKSTYRGKAKIINENFYMDGTSVFEIVEIKDTVGYIYNPGPSTWCSPDSIFVKGLLKTISGDMFYKS